MYKYSTSGGIPPHDSAINIHVVLVLHFLYTFCVLLNVFTMVVRAVEPCTTAAFSSRVVTVHEFCQ